MKSVKIEHPLRTISFECDDTKPEMDFEKELLKDYIKLHDDAYTVDRKGSKLVYEYKGLVDDVALIKKLFTSLEIKINELMEELGIAKANKDIALLENMDFLKRMVDYNMEVNHFHQYKYLPVGRRMDELAEEYAIFEKENDELDESFEVYHKGSRAILYKEYDNCSIDLCAYDDDEQEYAGALDDIRKHIDFKNDFIDDYNVVINWVNAVYSIGMNIQVLINEIRDYQDLLDSTQSDSYLNGTGDGTKMPIYFIDASDEVVKTFKNKYGSVAAAEAKTISITFGLEAIESGENMMICNMLLALQHFPKLIDKLVFSMVVEIEDADGTVLPEDQWKGYPPPMRWYSKLHTIPFSLFFFEDHDARAYILMGDLMADRKFKAEGDRMEISGDLLQEVSNRLFNACYSFMIFSHNTGFDPQGYVEAILANFDFPVTLEMVKERVEEDIKKGIQVKMERGYREEK